MGLFKHCHAATSHQLANYGFIFELVVRKNTFYKILVANGYCLTSEAVLMRGVSAGTFSHRQWKNSPDFALGRTLSHRSLFKIGDKTPGYPLTTCEINLFNPTNFPLLSREYVKIHEHYQ